MAKHKTEVNYNFGWIGLLGVVLVLAKIFGVAPVAAWSWWLVLLPFYIGLAILLAFLVIGAVSVGGAFGIAYMLDWWKNRKRKKQRAATIESMKNRQNT